jgi:rhodanese-related sulfurtransferase
VDLPKPISPTELYLELGTPRAPVLIDVRTGPIFDADDRLIVGARLPDNVDQWKRACWDHLWVVYGSQGDETSRVVAQALDEFGQEVAYLEGGFAAWVAQGFPTRKQLTTGVRKWITRERPKIACPWLIHASSTLRPSSSMCRPSRYSLKLRKTIGLMVNRYIGGSRHSDDDVSGLHLYRKIIRFWHYALPANSRMGYSKRHANLV